MATHYVYGSGDHGCLYDYGPHVAQCIEDAVDDLATLFELGRNRRRELKRNWSLELNSCRDGAEYCEINECNCDKPWEHEEDGDLATPEGWEGES